MRHKKEVRMTLDRVLSKYGFASRNESREIIREGRVRVNGKTIRDDQHWVQPASDTVSVDGLRIRRTHRVYLMFNKPKGVVTTHADEKGRKTVYDYLAGIKTWVFPIGRLDKNTSGLLIFTNDTDFGERLTNPASKVPKSYFAKVSGIVTEEEIKRLSEGVLLDRGERTLPAEVRLIRTSEKHSWLEITIVEGKNRQVRRMFETLNRAVLKLVRIRIGNLPLGNLEIGKYRLLNPSEIQSLMQKTPKESP